MGRGISLLLGLLTPLGALAGIWLNLNYMMMKGLPSTAGSVDRLFVLGELMFLITAAGMVLGLDGLLFRRRSAKQAARSTAAPAAEQPAPAQTTAAAEEREPARSR